MYVGMQGCCTESLTAGINDCSGTAAQPPLLPPAATAAPALRAPPPHPGRQAHPPLQPAAPPQHVRSRPLTAPSQQHACPRLVAPLPGCCRVYTMIAHRDGCCCSTPYSCTMLLQRRPLFRSTPCSCRPPRLSSPSSTRCGANVESSKMKVFQAAWLAFAGSVGNVIMSKALATGGWQGSTL